MCVGECAPHPTWLIPGRPGTQAPGCSALAPRAQLRGTLGLGIHCKVRIQWQVLVLGGQGQ